MSFSLFPLFSKKKILISLFLFLTIGGFFIFYQVYSVKTQTREMFRMNKTLQEENYYMAEFEFKMLGIAYLLDKGHYSRAFELFDQLYDQLKTKNGLIKMPEFKSKKEELEFYLKLQNPKTGAFMDDAYPLSSYHGPTSNVLAKLDKLYTETELPFKLHHRLSYLDQINTPEKLTNYLDDVSTVGWIGASFPQTSFHNARDIQALARDPELYDANEVDMIVQKHGPYEFSEEWKRTLIKWFYDFQDHETGLWGPKSKDGKLLKRDLNNTASILKNFVDKKGNSIHKEFPLKHREKLIEAALNVLSEPLPDRNEFVEIHEWNLKLSKSLRILFRYLWQDVTPELREKARDVLDSYITTVCKHFYVPEDGAFKYYMEADKASIDGTGTLGYSIFSEIGAYASKKQARIWGKPEDNIVQQKTINVQRLRNDHLEHFFKYDSINSYRIYREIPDYHQLGRNVFGIFYPRQTEVLDVMEYCRKTRQWIDTTPLTMGNWVSRQSVSQEFNSIPFDDAPSFYKTMPLKQVNEILSRNDKLILVGFDKLQIPRIRVEFHKK